MVVGPVLIAPVPVAFAGSTAVVPCKYSTGRPVMQPAEQGPAGREDGALTCRFLLHLPIGVWLGKKDLYVCAQAGTGRGSCQPRSSRAESPISSLVAYCPATCVSSGGLMAGPPCAARLRPRRRATLPNAEMPMGVVATYPLRRRVPIISGSLACSCRAAFFSSGDGASFHFRQWCFLLDKLVCRRRVGRSSKQP